MGLGHGLPSQGLGRCAGAGLEHGRHHGAGHGWLRGHNVLNQPALEALAEGPVVITVEIQIAMAFRTTLEINHLTSPSKVFAPRLVAFGTTIVALGIDRLPVHDAYGGGKFHAVLRISFELS